MAHKIPCVYMRGGTSKACFFKKEDLPAEESERDRILLRIFGSPDPKQIDGMGGTYTTTSKAAIISCSDREDADIDYFFNQVGIDRPTIGKDMNCGNISSAVGPYAIDEGLVQVVEPETIVRIYNKNTDKIIHAHVPVKEGKALTEGTYEIDGVPGTGARIDLEFFYPQGSATGTLLPTGNAKDKIDIDGQIFEYSFVDAANPIVFVNLEQFGVVPTILPDKFEQLPDISEIRRKLKIIRGSCAITAGFATSLQDAEENSPDLPKIVCCAPSKTYVDSGGRTIAQEQIDLVGRFLTLKEKMAPAFAVTAGICVGVAACTQGTIVQDLIGNSTEQDTQTIRIGHPCGIMDITAVLDSEKQVKSCRVGRTARRIMEGWAYL